MLIDQEDFLPADAVGDGIGNGKRNNNWPLSAQSDHICWIDQETTPAVA
ncbi:MAG: hypothetical protein KTR32_00060 [Granulosicoccus sp.]|nr:hypothetical protein [Granulosicoccus sp.]